MSERTQYISPYDDQHMLSKPNHDNGDTNFIATCDEQTRPTAERTQNLLTKLFPCKLGHKLRRNICWPNPSQASEDNKCITKNVEQTQNVFQQVLTKPLSCQRGNIIHLKICWLREDSNKSLPCQRGNKMHLFHAFTKSTPFLWWRKMHLNIC